VDNNLTGGDLKLMMKFEVPLKSCITETTYPTQRWPGCLFQRLNVISSLLLTRSPVGQWPDTGH
jgi:hypothetical protein